MADMNTFPKRSDFRDPSSGYHDINAFFRACETWIKTVYVKPSHYGRLIK